MKIINITGKKKEALNNKQVDQLNDLFEDELTESSKSAKTAILGQGADKILNEAVKVFNKKGFVFVYGLPFGMNFGAMTQVHESDDLYSDVGDILWAHTESRGEPKPDPLSSASEVEDTLRTILEEAVMGSKNPSDFSGDLGVSSDFDSLAIMWDDSSEMDELNACNPNFTPGEDEELNFLDSSNDYLGDVVVFTGKPPRGKKADYAKIITDGSGKVEPRFTKKTTLVVYSKKQISTSKIKQALKFGVKVMPYEDLDE